MTLIAMRGLALVPNSNNVMSWVDEQSDGWKNMFSLATFLLSLCDFMLTLC